MKTRSTPILRRLLLKITFFAHYTDQIYDMEKALARKPRKFQIDIVGSGELPADTALLMRSILIKRCAQTHLITNARSSLQGGAVLVWLLGDTRLIREDAKLFFRRADWQDEDQDEEVWKDGDPSEVDPDEVDNAQVLQHINEFLPVKEMAGRPVDFKVLKQFGLVDNDKVDHFLAAAFGKEIQPDKCAQAGEKPRTAATPEVPQPGQADRSN